MKIESASESDACYE